MHELQLIGADSGEAVSDSEAYLEYACNIKKLDTDILDYGGKGLNKENISLFVKFP